MTNALPTEPTLEEYFTEASLLLLAWRREPYDFLETHRLSKVVFGHELNHMNLGLWGEPGVDPGTALVERVASGANLKRGSRLLDLGAGLGETAASLCTQHALNSVIGVNKNPSQVAFANALAASRGLQDRVVHHLGDAATLLTSLPTNSVDSAIAVESLGLFSQPATLLEQLNRVLVPGGGFAACLNVQRGKLSLRDRVLVGRTFGFVPVSQEVWRTRLHTAGFHSLAVEDLTETVLDRACEQGLHRLEVLDASEFPRLILRHVRQLLARTRDAAANGRLGYELIVAQGPRPPAAAGTIGLPEETCG